MESTPLLTSSPSATSTSRWKTVFQRITIEPVQFLFSLSFSGSIPLVSQFVRHQIELKHNFSSVQRPCTEFQNDSIADQIQSETSMWLMYGIMAAMIPAFFTTVLLGGYSDRVGRKISLIPPLIGATARLLLFGAVYAFNLHIGFLVLASLFDGIGGGTTTMLMAVFAYAADSSDVNSRSTHIVILELCAGLANITSQLGLGYAIHLLGYLWTFVVLLGIILVTLLYVVFILPDVKPAKTQSDDADESKTSLFDVRHFTRTFALYVHDGPGKPGRRWKLRFTLCITMLVSAIQLGRFDVQTLFMVAAPLCFTAVWVGYFYATVYSVMHLTSIITTHFLVRHVGDLVLVVVGSLLGAAYELVFAFSTTTLMLFMAPIAGCASLLPIALIRAYNSKICEPSETGSMFASIAWMEMLGILIGGVFQNAVLAATWTWMKNFVFLVDAAAYIFTSVIVLLFVIFAHRQRQRRRQPVNLSNGASSSVHK